MNGFQLLADSYRKLKAQCPGEDNSDVDRQIKTLDFLAGCDDAEIYCLFDSGAFNDVLKAYCEKALLNCGIDEEDRRNVMREIRLLLSEKTASDITAETGYQS